MRSSLTNCLSLNASVLYNSMWVIFNVRISVILEKSFMNVNQLRLRYFSNYTKLDRGSLLGSALRSDIKTVIAQATKIDSY